MNTVHFTFYYAILLSLWKILLTDINALELTLLAIHILIHIVSINNYSFWTIEIIWYRALAQYITVDASFRKIPGTGKNMKNFVCLIYFSLHKKNRSVDVIRHQYQWHHQGGNMTYWRMRRQLWVMASSSSHIMMLRIDHGVANCRNEKCILLALTKIPKVFFSGVSRATMGITNVTTVWRATVIQGHCCNVLQGHFR